jgi:NADH-quinone oxidoreductase subunit J
MIEAVLFYMFAGLVAGTSLAVVMSRNIVRMAVFLLLTLGGVAGLYFMLAAEFIAALQLVIYAGGTLILILFGIMLTSKSPFMTYEAKLPEVVIAVSIASILLVALVAGILTATFASNPIDTGLYPVGLLGQALMGDYLIPFELAAVLLLVVMIGAAYVAKARRRDSTTEREE